MKLLIILFLLASCGARVKKDSKNKVWACIENSTFYKNEYVYKTLEEATSVCLLKGRSFK